MTESIRRRPALQNDLYMRSEELPGVPACETENNQDAELQAEALVHSLIVEEKRRVKPTHLPEIAPQAELPAGDPSDRESVRDSIAQILKAERDASVPVQKTSWLRRLPLPALGLPKRRQPAPTVAATPATSRQSRLSVPSWIKSYRLKRLHVALAIVAGIMFYRPWLLPLVFLLLFWLVVIAYLTVGPDRWSEIFQNAWMRLEAKRPERAERLRKKADRYARKWDRVLARLPEAWADRLALPDFSQKLASAADAPDPFDRLASEARNV